jgi:hypothetical protein
MGENVFLEGPGRTFNTSTVHVDVKADVASEPPIAQACSRLSNAIEDLHAALGTLAVTIQPIMGMPYPSAPLDDAKSPEDESSDLARFINRSAAGIRELALEVSSLKMRVEL